MADISGDITDGARTRGSRRHQSDAFSLVMGLLFMALGGFYLAHDLTGPDVDLRWVGPAALIAIGVAGLAASVRRRPPP
ncbi:MAG: hypothetical protein JJD92_11400 [Frankiaceae bacterium]|nr:hypothetical protein [Frankiaceae bacterium]